MQRYPLADVYAGLVSAHEYPEDEFDELGKDVAGGVHREKQSQWKSVLPFLVVLVLAPLLAWGAASFYTDHKQASTTTTTATSESTATSEPQQTSEPAQTEAAAATATPSASAQPSANAEADITKADVMVLNGTKVNGLAAQVAQKLKEAGFTKVGTDNANDWVASATAVYYHSGQEKAAEAIAKELQIDLRKENDQAVGDKAVVVLLRDDFKQ